MAPASRSGRPIQLPPTVSTLSSAQLTAQATAALSTILAGQPAGSVSVGALNVATGASFTAGAASGMWTASAYKLFVLEALLLRRQQSGVQLSSYERAQATTMIVNSDNEAGYAMFLAAGGSSGMALAANNSACPTR